jgi:hypothetical protein
MALAYSTWIPACKCVFVYRPSGLLYISNEIMFLCVKVKNTHNATLYLDMFHKEFKLLYWFLQE